MRSPEFRENAKYALKIAIVVCAFIFAACFLAAIDHHVSDMVFWSAIVAFVAMIIWLTLYLSKPKS